MAALKVDEVVAKWGDELMTILLEEDYVEMVGKGDKARIKMKTNLNTDAWHQIKVSLKDKLESAGMDPSEVDNVSAVKFRQAATKVAEGQKGTKSFDTGQTRNPEADNVAREGQAERAASARGMEDSVSDAAEVDKVDADIDSGAERVKKNLSADEKDNLRRLLYDPDRKDGFTQAEYNNIIKNKHVDHGPGHEARWKKYSEEGLEGLSDPKSMKPKPPKKPGSKGASPGTSTTKVTNWGMSSKLAAAFSGAGIDLPKNPTIEDAREAATKFVRAKMGPNAGPKDIAHVVNLVAELEQGDLASMAEVEKHLGNMGDLGKKKAFRSAADRPSRVKRLKGLVGKETARVEKAGRGGPAPDATRQARVEAIMSEAQKNMDLDPNLEEALETHKQVKERMGGGAKPQGTMAKLMKDGPGKLLGKLAHPGIGAGVGLLAMILLDQYGKLSDRNEASKDTQRLEALGGAPTAADILEQKKNEKAQIRRSLGLARQVDPSILKIVQQINDGDLTSSEQYAGPSRVEQMMNGTGDMPMELMLQMLQRQ